MVLGDMRYEYISRKEDMRTRTSQNLSQLNDGIIGAVLETSCTSQLTNIERDTSR